MHTTSLAVIMQSLSNYDKTTKVNPNAVREFENMRDVVKNLNCVMYQNLAGITRVSSRQILTVSTKHRRWTFTRMSSFLFSTDGFLYPHPQHISSESWARRKTLPEAAIVGENWYHHHCELQTQQPVRFEENGAFEALIECAPRERDDKYCLFELESHPLCIEVIGMLLRIGTTRHP